MDRILGEITERWVSKRSRMYFVEWKIDWSSQWRSNEGCDEGDE